MYITNDKKQTYLFCRLKLVVETFENWFNILNQPIKIPQSCLANEQENVIIKLWGLV